MPSDDDQQYNLDFIFKPKSMAVIGLSTRNSDNPGNAIFSKNLMEMSVKTYGITPRADEIDGHKVYRSFDKLPEIPDLAVVAVSAKNTKSVIQEAAELGVKGAVIIAGGFSEAGREGMKMQNELVKICSDYNMPFIGPNCVGIYSPPILDTLFLPSERLVKPKAGNVAVISQSGGVLIDQFFISLKERNIGVSTAVSIGNKAMVNEAMLLKYFEKDNTTDVITFYLEGFHLGDGRRFCEEARKSRKDVVVYSGGTTSAGKAAAGSHTGSLAADGSIMKGAYKQYSIVNPINEQDLQMTLKTYSMLANPFRKYSTMAIHGDRIAVLSVSGGHGVLCADLLDKYGLGLTKFTERQKEDISFLLNPIASRIAGLNNPIDITGSGTDDDIVNILEYLFNAPNVEMILTLLVPQVPQLTMGLGRAINKVGNKYKKPIIAYVPWTPKYDLIRDALELQHIPCAHTIEETVQMANALKLKGIGGIRKKMSWNSNN
ncbi:Acetate--CoA ligase [ADP-forming] II subunit alpha [Candidatus Lokiarchaeum ossiferum]|uniref:Acetate--CoA ligase [ADP-forming] II subunit alpha n=1 Tax=Candidatus Lokiarchaeum ossiferum TaxID=2951803 RepID=A0ABY6HWH2_9ARCH|nr:Acetate--CoA ligase [ADP-forming] II subunit alpha [Candidatus Lokiarchaeum sp. B-35]